MKITADHLRFWQHKKAPPPTWFKVAPKPRLAMPSLVDNLIHVLINQQTPRKLGHEHEISNMLVTLRHIRKRDGSVYAWMKEGLVSGTYTPKQRVFARRWICRIEGG